MLSQDLALLYGVDPVTWGKRIQLLEEVYQFLADGMRKGTGVLDMKNTDPVIEDLWAKFSTGKLNIEGLRRSFALVKPVWDSRRIRRL